jgi:autotransporter translocation and assembly factor TamB
MSGIFDAPAATSASRSLISGSVLVASAMAAVFAAISGSARSRLSSSGSARMPVSGEVRLRGIRLAMRAH